MRRRLSEEVEEEVELRGTYMRRVSEEVEEEVE